MRDYAVIHSLWFDFEPVKGQFQGLVIPVDQYGFNPKISPRDSKQTLLDIKVGDQVFNHNQILTVSKVAIFRATPAPVVTSEKPVFEVYDGRNWLERINAKQNPYLP